MPAEETISVKFTGDAGPLAKTTEQLTAQLKRFEDALKRTAQGSDSFNRINRAIEATKSRIDLLGKVDSFQHLKRGGDQATQSLINLSRVAQDAPYGFMGIANNLNPLLESFQRLKAETGTTKAAFGALVSGLTGPAGIGLALGVVSSLIVTFGDKLFNSKQGIDANTLALEKFRIEGEAASKMVDNLMASLDRTNRVAKLNLEANIGSGDQADLMDLRARSIQQRSITTAAEAALKRLNKIKSDVGDQLRGLLTPEQQRAMSDGLLGAFVEDLSKDAKKTYDAFKEAEKNAEKGIEDLRESGVKQEEIYAQIRLLKRNINEKSQKEAEDAHKKELAEQKKQEEEREKLRQKELENLIRHQMLRFNLENQEGPLEGIKAPAFDRKPSKAMTDAVEMRVPVILVPDGEVDIEKLGLAINKALDKMTDQQKFEKKLEQMKASIKSFGDYLGDTLGKAFADVFDAIIDGEDPLKAFLNSLKQTVKQVASELIATYIRVAIFKALASPATGGGSAASGAAGLLKILGFAKGGIVPGTGSGDTVPAMLTPGELVVPKNLAPQIAAMLGYGSQALARSMPQGSRSTSQYAGEGSMNIHLTGEFRQSGDDLVQVINKVIKSQRRAF